MNAPKTKSSAKSKDGDSPKTTKSKNTKSKDDPAGAFDPADPFGLKKKPAAKGDAKKDEKKDEKKE
ncbi:MAG: hypothetical protein HZA46_11855 [Planctomycetales bacterium]|nr:hypothetical protein [Planctomycetales bacterium]